MQSAIVTEFLSFLVEVNTFDVHLIVDNRVKAWLAKRPRSTSTSPQPTPHGSIRCERWGIITQKAIRRGSFSNVKELVNKIERASTGWTATAQSILAKVERRSSVSATLTTASARRAWEVHCSRADPKGDHPSLGAHRIGGRAFGSRARCAKGS